MIFTRKALWSFLVGTLAAIPVVHGVREVSPAVHETAAAPSEVKAEATTPETRKVLEEARRRDEFDDAPAPVVVAALATSPRYVLASADRTAAGHPVADADRAPLSRRALGRPRVRAPDAG